MHLQAVLEVFLAEAGGPGEDADAGGEAVAGGGEGGLVLLKLGLDRAGLEHELGEKALVHKAMVVARVVVD